MNADAIRSALAATLRYLAAILPEDPVVWWGNDVLRWTVERLWISAGTAAEQYRREAGLAKGVDPWREIYRHRNVIAHALPGHVRHERLWRESQDALPRLIAAVEAA